MSQNIWEIKNHSLHRQKRRAQLISSYLKAAHAGRILDIGCAEGYATSYISKTGAFLVGIDTNLESLVEAKKKVLNVEFLNASISNLPFRSGFFDAVCILEVLEHLDVKSQKKGFQEIDRISSKRGNIIISVPYKENIIKTTCVHCGKITPLYGHLHSLDESNIAEILPNTDYELNSSYRLPNLQVVSCSGIFEGLPLAVWLLLNHLLGFIRKGYWIVLHYSKQEKTGI